jgi:hypothetical protein
MAVAVEKAASTSWLERSHGTGDPRPYHAAVMTLKASAEEQIDKILPPGLKDAFAQYRKFRRGHRVRG